MSMLCFTRVTLQPMKQADMYWWQFLDLLDEGPSSSWPDNMWYIYLLGCSCTHGTWHNGTPRRTTFWHTVESFHTAFYNEILWDVQMTLVRNLTQSRKTETLSSSSTALQDHGREIFYVDEGSGYQGSTLGWSVKQWDGLAECGTRRLFVTCRPECPVNTSDSVCEEGEMVDCRCVAESVGREVSKVVHIVCPLVVWIECDLNMFPCDHIRIHVCTSALID